MGSNIAGDVVGRTTGSENAKFATKLGTAFLGSLINPKGADKFVSGLFNKAKESRPSDARVIDRSAIPALETLEIELTKGGSESWKNKMFTKIKELRDRFKDGSIEVDELERFKPSINNLIEELYAEGSHSKPGIKSARRFANKLASIVDGSLTKYGKRNREWEKYYRPANEAYGAIAESRKLRSVIKRWKKTLGTTEL